MSKYTIGHSGEVCDWDIMLAAPKIPHVLRVQEFADPQHEVTVIECRRPVLTW